MTQVVAEWAAKRDRREHELTTIREEKSKLFTTNKDTLDTTLRQKMSELVENFQSVCRRSGAVLSGSLATNSPPSTG